MVKKIHVKDEPSDDVKELTKKILEDDELLETLKQYLEV